MSTDELERTARHRPRPELRDPEAMLAGILAAGPSVDSTARSRSRRRPLLLVGVAAAVAAAAVVVPAVLPSSSPGGAQPAAAVELHRLATAATASGDDPLQPGQFRHVIVTEHQVQPELSTSLESWTSADGKVWRRDVTTHGDGTPGRTEVYLFDHPEPVADYPTDPDALQRYLVAHASGSTSTDEAVFQALADLLRADVVPAALRSAAAQVLARTGHVLLGPRTTDTYGRSVQEVDFVDEVGRPGELQAIVFGTADARVTAERITTDGPSTAGPYYESAVSPADVTTAVPADVLRDAVVYGSGTEGGEGQAG